MVSNVRCSNAFKLYGSTVIISVGSADAKINTILAEGILGSLDPTLVISRHLIVYSYKVAVKTLTF